MPDLVNDELKRSGRCLVVVSEGFPVGSLGERKDSFGHTMFSASEMTVAQIVVNHLNKVGLKAHGAARANVMGTDQRTVMMYASTVDLEEAYKLGQKAAFIAVEDGSGYMSTILRDPGPVYNVRYDKVPLVQVANSERAFPQAWITQNRIDVTDEFLRYARPLIGDHWPAVPLVDGRQRFARLRQIFAARKLPAYLPQAHRRSATPAE
jgi:6-phosphofructokinase 1